MRTFRVLIVERDGAAGDRLHRWLEELQCEMAGRVETVREARSVAELGAIDFAVFDPRAPQELGVAEPLPGSLSENDALCADILRTSSDAIVSVEEPGGIRLYNSGAQALFGWTEEEILGRPLEALLSERQQSSCACGSRHTSGDGLHLVGVRKDGTTFPACVRLSAVSGARCRRTAIIRDMSEQERLVRQFVQAQKMEAVGLVAAGIAHDFNNALTALRAQLYVASLQLGSCHALEECEAILDQCACLTGRLLGFSSPRVAGSGLMDLRSSVAESLRMARSLLPKGMGIAADLGTEPLWVRLDQSQSMHAVLNLILNARDAMPEGGTISIHAAASSGVCRLVVEDTGQGMNAETIARAFEPFFTTKAPGQGTGLGLAIVRQIVEGAGGSVHLSSEAGSGTRVTLELPRPLDPEAVRPSAASAAAVPVPAGED